MLLQLDFIIFRVLRLVYKGYRCFANETFAKPSNLIFAHKKTAEAVFLFITLHQRLLYSVQ